MKIQLDDGKILKTEIFQNQKKTKRTSVDFLTFVEYGHLFEAQLMTITNFLKKGIEKNDKDPFALQLETEIRTKLNTAIAQNKNAKVWVVAKSVEVFFNKIIKVTLLSTFELVIPL